MNLCISQVILWAVTATDLATSLLTAMALDREGDGVGAEPGSQAAAAVVTVVDVHLHRLLLYVQVLLSRYLFMFYAPPPFHFPFHFPHKSVCDMTIDPFPVLSATTICRCRHNLNFFHAPTHH